MQSADTLNTFQVLILWSLWVREAPSTSSINAAAHFACYGSAPSNVVPFHASESVHPPASTKGVLERFGNSWTGFYTGPNTRPCDSYCELGVRNAGKLSRSVAEILPSYFETLCALSAPEPLQNMCWGYFKSLTLTRAR